MTLVGEAEALEAVVAPLQARGVFVRFLRVKVPYHSHYMDPLRTELEQSLEGIIPRAATLPLYSTVTGALVDGRDLDAGYWWRNVREPVYFAAAAGAMIEDGYTTFLELSPHPVLSASIGECLALKDRPGLAVPSLRRQEEERALMLGALGALYGAGYTPRWEDVFGEGGHLVPLPTYPWQRERHWAETAEARQDRLGQGAHPLLGRPVAGAHPAWQHDLSRRRLPYLEDHRLRQAPLLPGAAYVEMALAAAGQTWGQGALELEEVAFKKALFLPPPEVAGATAVQTTLDPETGRLRVYSREGTRAAAPGLIAPAGPAPGRCTPRPPCARARTARARPRRPCPPCASAAGSPSPRRTPTPPSPAWASTTAPPSRA